MNRIVKNIPNSITCLNVLCGSLAIIFASRASHSFANLSGLQWAYIFVGLAAVADFCDGLAARSLHAYSNMGKELDSLCDLVSFGVAPALILLNALETSSNCGLWIFAALLIPVAAALRLAKFNIDPRQTTSFLGLPVPANAIFWIGYSELMQTSIPALAEWWWVIPAVIIFSGLMISELPLFSLKLHSLSLKTSWRQICLLLAALILLFCLGVGGLFWLIIFYVGLSIATERR